MSYRFTTRNNIQLNVAKTDWQSHGDQMGSVRRTVFIQEQKVSADEEWDGKDELDSTLHFFAEVIPTTDFSLASHAAQPLELTLSQDAPENNQVHESELQTTIVATGRVLEDGKIGRMCVLQEFRGLGVGQALMQEILHHLITNTPLRSVYLYAQISARKFYETLGFCAVGDTFFEAGIEHIRMELNLDDASLLPLIYQDRVLRLSSPSSFNAQLLNILQCGRYAVDILSHSLDAKLFTQDVADALSTIVRNHRQAKARILVEDTRPLTGISHPLVTLSQRLSSAVDIKRLKNAPDIGDEAYVIVDRKLLLFFNNEMEFEGFVRFKAAAECKHLLESFEHLWQVYAEQDPNLSRLFI